MHVESINAKHAALEAEMRRRLWWSLVTFDHRISELSDEKTTSLLPAWDCHVPSNINDFELRPEMKNSPTAHEKPAEALFPVVRSEIADSVRNSTFHIRMFNPAFIAAVKPKATPASAGVDTSELAGTVTAIESKWLSNCNSEDPLHFMTIWTARGALARNKLLEHYSGRAASKSPTEAERKAAFSSAIMMLKCDTTLKRSPSVTRYLWLSDLYFPALAYVHLLTDLTRHPGNDDAGRAWDAMGANYDALAPREKQLSTDEHGSIHFLFVSWARVVIQAWEAREIYLRKQSKPIPTLPRMVLDITNRFVHMSSGINPDNEFEFPDQASGTKNDNDDFLTRLNPSVTGSHPSAVGGMEPQEFMPSALFGAHFEQTPPDLNMDHFLADMDWRWMETQGW